jgi:hypothetical protein
MTRILTLILVICFSCKNVSSNNYINITIKKFDSCILLIYSPYNCFYEIGFNETGSGNFKTLVKNSTNNNSENDSLISNYFFTINSETDIQKIRKIIEQVKTNDTLSSSRMVDTYEFELIVDKRKYIDVYGQNENIDRLLKVLFQYTKNSDDKCGFIGLFQKVIKNISD